MIWPIAQEGGERVDVSLRVGASVSHGQETRAGVLLGEVLIGKLLAVDGLATGTVATGEVTTLEHEVGDDTVEGRALVAESGSTGAQLLEVLGGLGDDVVVEGEVDAARLDCRTRIDVSSCFLWCYKGG